jgi:transposase
VECCFSKLKQFRRVATRLLVSSARLGGFIFSSLADGNKNLRDSASRLSASD